MGSVTFWVGHYHCDRLGRPWEATGGHGRPWVRSVLGWTLPLAQAREAMGGHGRPWEAMGSVTFGLDTAIGTGSGSHGRPREATGGHGFGNLSKCMDHRSSFASAWATGRPFRVHGSPVVLSKCMGHRSSFPNVWVTGRPFQMYGSPVALYKCMAPLQKYGSLSGLGVRIEVCGTTIAGFCILLGPHNNAHRSASLPNTA